MRKGETLGIVSESGCGKTTLGRTILKLTEPTDGKIVFNGRDVTGFSRRQMREVRREMQIVFQDPYASLNPRMTVREIVARPLRINKLYRQGGRARIELLRTVDLAGARQPLPHEFSGGQRQRASASRALALNPQLMVLDEPGLGARRLDPGPGDQPARVIAARLRPHLPLRGATCPSSGTSRPGRRHVPGQDRRDRDT